MPKKTDNIKAMAVSGRVWRLRVNPSMMSKLSIPLMIAPIKKYSGFFSPVRINAKQTPGRTLCETASPMSARLRKKVKHPTMADIPQRITDPTTTNRTFGSRRSKKSIRFWDVIFRALESYVHEVDHLLEKAQLVCRCMLLSRARQ